MNRQMDLVHMASALCALLFIVVFLGGGLFFLYKAVKNQKTILSITSDGLSFGSKIYRWEDITEIGIMQKYTNRKDLYCTTRLHPYTVELALSKGLNSKQIEIVFGALRTEVITLHPHVRLAERTDDEPDC